MQNTPPSDVLAHLQASLDTTGLPGHIKDNLLLASSQLMTGLQPESVVCGLLATVGAIARSTDGAALRAAGLAAQHLGTKLLLEAALCPPTTTH